MKRVIFLLDAQDSLDEITRYTEDNWPDPDQEAGTLPKYVVSIINACNDIPRRVTFLTDAARNTKYGIVRYFRRGRHIIFYRETEESFEVIQILHERMNFAAYLD
jgi:plasmid stabilization system protein ParE